jgi:hypothetical protein
MAREPGDCSQSVNGRLGHQPTDQMPESAPHARRSRAVKIRSTLQRPYSLHRPSHTLTLPSDRPSIEVASPRAPNAQWKLNELHEAKRDRKRQTERPVAQLTRLVDHVTLHKGPAAA